MSDESNLKLSIRTPAQLDVLFTTARAWSLDHLMAGHRVTFDLHTETRKEAQSRKFHALRDSIVKSGHTLNGHTYTEIEWKRILKSGHAIATNAETKLIRGIEGEIIDLCDESLSDMGVRRTASLIEYTLAYCAMNRIPTIDEEATK
jgi:uncharacterized protein YicC (UPF0701 family)